MVQKKTVGILVGVETSIKAAQDWIFGVILLMTSLAKFVPLAPAMPQDNLDQSWVYGMNQAIAQGLVLGRDVLFTFGPYASIYTKTFHPATDHLMVWGGCYLGLSFFVAAFINFKDSEWYLRTGLLLTLAALIYLVDSLFFFYPLLVGIYLFKATLLREVEQSNPRRWYALLIILFAPFGLFPLIKGSALIACMAISVFSVLLLSKERCWRSVVIVCLAPIISMVLFWKLANQPFAALPSYLISMVPMISGYTEAMAAEGDTYEALFYVATCVILLWAVFLKIKAPFFKKATVVLMFFVVLFLAFKAGFVRHDGHAMISSMMLLMAALLAGTMALEKHMSISLIAATACWIYIDAAHVKTDTGRLMGNLKTTYSSAVNGLKVRIFDKGKLGRDFEERIGNLKSRAGFPMLKGTTDIYSHDQSYLIASGNNWNPRPIFQSYSVYTPELAEKNKAHLIGKNRPDNIIFKMQAIDGRVPALEDGASWPVLLLNYQPTSILNGYFFLKNRQFNQNLLDHQKSISKKTYVLGDKIDLPKFNTLIFAKINVRQTLLGRVWNTLFKPSQLEIKFTMENGVVRTYRLIANMAKTGFLLSPLLENTEEFGLLYAGIEYLDDKQVKTISIDAISARKFWNDEFELEFISLDHDQKREYLGLYEFSKPLDESELSKISHAEKCDGSIDFVNGISPSPSLFKTRFSLNVHGWLAKSVDKSEIPENVYLVLTAHSGRRFFIKTKPKHRPDLGTHFKKSHLDSAGYEVAADVSKLRGEYVLGLAYLENDSMNICPQFNIPGVIGAKGLH